MSYLLIYFLYLPLSSKFDFYISLLSPPQRSVSVSLTVLLFYLWHIFTQFQRSCSPLAHSIFMTSFLSPLDNIIRIVEELTNSNGPYRRACFQASLQTITQNLNEAKNVIILHLLNESHSNKGNNSSVNIYPHH